MWFFAGCFIVFGMPLFFVSDNWWRQLWGGLAMLFLGGLAIAFANNGVQKGEIRLQYSLIRRANQPRTFWAVVAISGTAGAGVVVDAIWILFFKIYVGE